MIIISSIILFIAKSEKIITMFSIFTPIICGALINYNTKQKEIFNTYYEPLYSYIRTYYDILSQPYDRLSMGKKHEMMSKIAEDLLNFLNDNLKYASEEVCESLEMMLFYKYENINKQNEFQDIYNLNTIIPILMKEILQNYNVNHFNHYLLRRHYMAKDKFHKSNGLLYNYIDSFLINIGRKKEYAISLYEVVEFYQNIMIYRDEHYKDTYKLYKYCKRNFNLKSKSDCNRIINELKNKFGLKIKKIKISEK